MAERTGTCSECGARYKIPAAFKGTRAKCRKCGGIVEIPPLEEKVPEKTVPEPPEKTTKGKSPPLGAAKKPALAPRTRGAGKVAPSRGVVRRSTASRAGGRRSAARRASPRRRGGEAEKEEGTPNWIWIVAGVSLVGIVVILIVLFSGGSGEETPADLASLKAGGGAAGPEEQPKTAQGPERKPAAPEAGKEQPAAQPAVETPKKEEKKAPTPQEIPSEAKDVDPIIKFEPLPPIIGCDEETFKKLSDCFVNGFIKEELRPWQRKSLKKQFDQAGYEKVPILINAFNGLDLLKPDDVVIAFRVAEMWNALTGKGFVDVPIKGDTSREEMEANLPLNVKNIYAIYNIWKKKVGDVEAQKSFFAKCDKHKQAAAEKDQ